MAKTLMSPRPYSLVRQALPSSLQKPTQRLFISPFLALRNKTEATLFSSSTPTANNTIKPCLETYGLLKLRFGLVSNRRFIAGAPHVNDGGSIDSPLMQSMESRIKEELNAESVSVKDAYGDGRHVSIDVVSEAFEGQSAVNRQRMVYKAIWEELQTVVHAVDQMTTRTPTEAAAHK